MFRACMTRIFSNVSSKSALSSNGILCPTNDSLRLASAFQAPSEINHSSTTRTLFTSPTLFAKTRKRRKRYPFFWLQDKYHKYYDENLTPLNEKFYQEFLNEKYSPANKSSPLRQEPWSTNESWTPESVRTGVIARKLGSFPQWTREGKMLVNTCLQVSDNHVVKYHPPEEFAKLGRPVDRVRYAGFGCIIVGSDSRDPRQFTAEYNGLFKESGVMTKKKLTRFFITHNSRLEPGTPLIASHFRPGMFVDVYGKSIELGIQGLRRRHQMKLGRKTHGVTKAHNRIGSIGRGRQWCGPVKGSRRGGHEGGERTVMPGLKVWRVNTKYNLIFLQGPAVPGSVGEYINIMDSRIYEKRPCDMETPPPFPTVSLEENSKLAEDLYHPDIHLSSDPTIIFEVSEEEKKAAALAARRIGKAKTAQKIR